MINLIYLKNDLVSKGAYSSETSQMGLSKILSSRVRKLLSRGTKVLSFEIFSRYADCQLGGVPTKCQHSVS